MWWWYALLALSIPMLGMAFFIDLEQTVRAAGDLCLDGVQPFPFLLFRHGQHGYTGSTTFTKIASINTVETAPVPGKMQENTQMVERFETSLEIACSVYQTFMESLEEQF